MPFNFFEEDAVEVKTAKEVKEQQKEDFEVKKHLYGAGRDGWTKEWYERIKEAYYNNTLTIGYISPVYNEENKRFEYPVKKGTPEQEAVSMIATIMAENKKEEDLAEVDKVALMALCHPIVKTKIKAKEYEEAIRTICVPESLEWHKLTNWRHLDELMKYRPNLYVDWKMKGYIPSNIDTEVMETLEADEDDKAFVERLRREVPADSPLRKPHEDWFKENKEKRKW